MTSQDWNCPACTTVNPLAAKFCSECGARRQLPEDTLSGNQTTSGAPQRPFVRTDETIGGGATYAGGGNHGQSQDRVFQPGQRVGRDARYELITKLGEGGMGSVWKARDLQLGRDVAIKRVLGHGSTMLRERFQRETQAVVGLRHPNIVTVFDAGEDDHGMYMVMEFVPGYTLSAYLHQGAMKPEVAVHVMLGLCSGAAHAHKKGVVHRDIKPSNVMLDEGGIPKLLDFGLVRIEGASELSVAGVGMGTMDYAAPEQRLDASKADARSDVYALGLVFYEMLTGLRPPVTLRRVPEQWRTLIEKATDSVAADRYASASEFWVDIEATRRHPPSGSHPAQPVESGEQSRAGTWRTAYSWEQIKKEGALRRMREEEELKAMNSGGSGSDSSNVNERSFGRNFLDYMKFYFLGIRPK